MYYRKIVDEIGNGKTEEGTVMVLGFDNDMVAMQLGVLRIHVVGKEVNVLLSRCAEEQQHCQPARNDDI